VLEDRSVPSTLTVTNNSDTGVSGDGSLRGEIAAAHDGDTIVFAHALQNKTITLAGKALSVTESITVQGLGQNKLTISGNDASGVFAISGSASVSIAGLTISNGQATAGGGILLEGSAALSISECELSHNEAIGTTASGGFGGGIEDNSTGTLTVANCWFEHNTAIAEVANDPIVSSEYTFAAGGAIDVNLTDTGAANISDSAFVGNQALGGSPGASAGGGALSNSSNLGATMTVTGCTLADNEAIGAANGDGATNFGSGQGGGINSIGGLTVSDSMLTNNRAQGAPLAADVVPSQTVLSNSGTAGGGIFCLDLAGSSVLIADSTIAGNQAVGGSGPAPAVAEGGGLSLILVPSGLVTDCTIVGNIARGGSGGSGVAGAAGVSGGLDLAVGSVVTVNDCTLLENQAIGGAGGAGAMGGEGAGGGINVGSGVVLGFPDNSSLTLTHCILVGNQAVGGAGGSGSNGGNGLGGGISVLTGSSASTTSSSIIFNVALGGAGETGGSRGDGIGGVYNLGTFIPDPFTIVAWNYASTSNNNIYSA
jgi:hypothetical protein